MAGTERATKQTESVKLVAYLGTRVSRAKTNARIHVEETGAVHQLLYSVGTGVKLGTRACFAAQMIRTRRVFELSTTLWF